MRLVVRNILLIALACLCVGGCKRKEPETPDPGSPTGEVRVASGDRLGWTQQAADATELASYQYALFVDGTRTVLTGVACASAGSAFECSAILPALNPGTHTLELASFIVDGSRTAESARSAALRVIAGGATSSFSVSSVVVTTAEQVRLNLAPVAEGLQSPSDLAFGPDGLIFVAERGGAIRVIRDGVLVETPALDLSSDIGRAEGGI